MRKRVLLILIFATLILPGSIFAANLAPNCKAYCATSTYDGPPSGQTCICNPLTAGSFEDIVNNIIDFIFKIAVVLAPLMAVIGGFMFVTAGGNLQRLTQAKNLLIWTAVGFVIVLLSKGLLAMINQILGVK